MSFGSPRMTNHRTESPPLCQSNSGIWLTCEIRGFSARRSSPNARCASWARVTDPPALLLSLDRLVFQDRIRAFLHVAGWTALARVGDYMVAGLAPSGAMTVTVCDPTAPYQTVPDWMVELCARLPGHPGVDRATLVSYATFSAASKDLAFAHGLELMDHADLNRELHRVLPSVAQSWPMSSRDSHAARNDATESTRSEHYRAPGVSIGANPIDPAIMTDV